MHTRPVGAGEPADLALDDGIDPGFVAECERGADLDADGAEALGFGELGGLAVGAGEPERQADLGDLRQVGHVARAVDGFPAALSCSGPRGGALWPPARSPSTTKPSTLPLDLRARVCARVAEETMARNRGRASRGRGGAEKCGRVETGNRLAAGDLVLDVDLQLGRLARGEPVERGPGSSAECRRPIRT